MGSYDYILKLIPGGHFLGNPIRDNQEYRGSFTVLEWPPKFFWKTFRPSVCLSVCLSICLSLCLSLSLSLSVSLSVSLSLSLCLSVSLSLTFSVSYTSTLSLYHTLVSILFTFTTNLSYTAFLTTSFLTTSLNLLKSIGTCANFPIPNLSKSWFRQTVVFL